MRRMRKGTFVLSLTALICLAEPPSRTASKAEIDKWMTGECSNWGRWGKTDQMGAVNLITDAKRKEAASLVREGLSVSLAHNPITDKAPDNDSPFRHTMLSTGQHPSGPFVMDECAVSYHGLAHTHIIHKMLGGHTAVLGTSGAGESWTVEPLLQPAMASLPNTHIVF